MKSEGHKGNQKHRVVKPKMTKEERRKKYTDIARKRRQKQYDRENGSRFGRGRTNQLVCYNCRQPGHTISNCPQNNQNHQQEDGCIEVDKSSTTNATSAAVVDGENAVASTKIVLCYKCGSNQHTLQQCKKRGRSGKVYDDEDLPFATCFICKQKGHLASGCPQNQNGIYVNGGNCRYCGSIRHRAAECPEKKKKKKENEEEEEKSSDIEELLEQPRQEKKTQKISKKEKSPKQAETKSKKRRVVKF